MSKETSNASLHGHATLTDQVQGEAEAEKRTAEVSMSSIVTNVLNDKGPDAEAILFREDEIIAERYEVISSLGQGGMGTVYLVRDQVAGENRALKVMAGWMSQESQAAKRFLNEARARDFRHAYCPDDRYLSLEYSQFVVYHDDETH